MPIKIKIFDKLQPRSRRIPQPVWEAHKEEIISVYKSNDLIYTVDWMAKSYNFHAS